MTTELPAHLKGKERWFDFDSGATVPDWMLRDPNWQNNLHIQAEPTYTRFPNGQVHQSCFPHHIARWVLEEHAVIVARPAEWEPEVPRQNTFDLEAQASRFPAVKGEVR